MTQEIRLALNADTTPLAISDTLVFKSCQERAREASHAGFSAVNVDRGEPGLGPPEVLNILKENRLEVASGFFHGRFYEPESQTEILEQALAQAEFSAAIGQTCLFVSAWVSPRERQAVAGRVVDGQGPALTEAEFKHMAGVLERIADVWQPYGIQMCYHPHVATYVEAPHEIDRLMELTNPALVKLGPDTGHLFYGGADPILTIERYADRVGAIHLKDVQAGVLDEVRRRSLDYRQACGLGVWIEAGEGDIDFRSLFDLLRRRNWTGWAILETDHTELPTALESSRKSREYLREVIGL